MNAAAHTMARAACCITSPLFVMIGHRISLFPVCFRVINKMTHVSIHKKNIKINTNKQIYNNLLLKRGRQK